MTDHTYVLWLLIGIFSANIAIGLVVLFYILWPRNGKDGKSDRFRIYFTTEQGTSESVAAALCGTLQSILYPCEIVDLASYEPEEIAQDAAKFSRHLFLIPTYAAEPPDDAKWFFDWIRDAAKDFRIGNALLKDMNFAVFGLGDSDYEMEFNKAACELDALLVTLGASRIIPPVLWDLKSGEDVIASSDTWLQDVLQALRSQGKKDVGRSPNGTVPVSLDKSGTETESEDESASVVDLEDMGGAIAKAGSVRTDGTEGVRRRGGKRRILASVENQFDDVVDQKVAGDAKEMVTPIVRQSLTKQGYKIVGSHSGVKICRWTKAMLRGRGGCYKHSFYGIESHRCMEATPSLACANKCVFCWRHHTNPVGTSWKWQQDPPEMIVNGAIAEHVGMVKQMRGVPGVIPQRLQEGMQPVHCALSLVGEPIMYPEINNLVNLLHDRKISTFMVTNAQFPDAITNLNPVTQLYISVDAPSPEALKKIDRPLFRDFWERFLQSMDALREKQQRTVYRLTLVKAWNTDELEGYAQLVRRGQPDFVEVKGVTYCGDSKGPGLTMENVPWHEEVSVFVDKLAALLEPDYGIACEHEHSNCLLISHRKFFIDGRWHTWIDYERFHDLIAAGEPFTSLDYIAATPAWAVVGAMEQGFDPAETRFKRKGKKVDLSGC